MKVFNSDDRCPKCGMMPMTWKYSPAMWAGYLTNNIGGVKALAKPPNDVIVVTCHCGYNWDALPLDYKEGGE